MSGELEYPATWGDEEDFNTVRDRTSNHFELPGEGFDIVRERVVGAITGENTVAQWE